MGFKVLRYYFLLILLGTRMLSTAQSPVFKNLTMADGLSHSLVYSIGQDKYGFMWIGTENGLNVYDGVRFKHLFSKANDKTTIPTNSISDLLFENDSVWIATGGGLCKMDIRSKKCRQINLGDNISAVTLFLNTKKEVLWIGTNAGLIRYTIKSGKLKKFNTETSNISHNIVRSIFEDLDGNLWVGTFDKLNKLPANSSVFEIIDLKGNYSPKIENNLILCIQSGNQENDSVLWVGTQTGLVEFNRSTYDVEFFREENSGLLNSTSKTILKTDEDKLWIGTDFGLAEMNSNLDIRIHLHDPNKNSTLVNSIVWDVFEDNSGTIWFGTSNGISILSKTSNRFRFYPMTFTRANHVAGYSVRHIIEDTKKNYWLATQFGVINYNHEAGFIETFNSEQSKSKRLTIDGTLNLFEDSKQRIWIASDGGPVVWNSSTNKLSTYTAHFNTGKGLRSNYVTGFYELKDGTILVNTRKGLHKGVEKNGVFEFQFIRNLESDFVALNDYLWSAKDNSLQKINPQTFETEDEIVFKTEEEGLKIRTLYFSHDNKIWLGVDNGLIRYDIEKKQYYFFEIESNKTLPIISLLEDNIGNIWAASYSAIIKFSIDSEKFEVFPSGIEIPINRFNKNSCVKTEAGDLIFGGQDGFIEFSPEDITKSNFISPTYFTKLQIANKEITPEETDIGKNILQKDISFTSDLTLNYDNRSFAIEFSSLHFGNRNTISYEYMLDGEDVDWNFINGDIGQASYANLKSGKYVFRVKGTNNDGVWNPNETVLNIRIKPPLWASPAFVTMYFLLLGLLIIALFYYFTSRAKMRTQLKLARLEQKHTESLSKTRQQFFTNISHEFKAPLSLIISPAEKLVHSRSLNQEDKNYVRIIENNARRLLWLNNQFLDFRKLENKALSLRISEFNIVEFAKNVFFLFSDKAERKQITYSFNSDFEVLDVKLDLRKIETILFNLLSNAFKFTPENGAISISLSSCNFNSKNGLCISVKDSGIGISNEDQKKIFNRFYQAKEAIKMERGSGIGLTLVNEYTLMHQGNINLISEPGKGAEFQVNFPLNINYTSENVLLKEPEVNQTLLKPKKANIEESIIEPNTGKPKILLLEDDREIIDFICLSLKMKYNIQVAHDGKEALQMISKYLPDLVISDVVMPKMNGIEFTKKFKSNPKTSHIPLIMLTGQSEKEKQLEGFKSGADAYMLKPFEIDLLEVRIQNFLKGRDKYTEYLKLDTISKPKDNKIDSLDEKLLKQVVACIEKYISEPDLNIEKICDEIGVSHSTLYRKVKILTGYNVNELIRTVRVRRAEQLLRTKKFSVAEVMYETGFSSHSYFSKCFKKQYRLTPKEYIEKQ